MMALTSVALFFLFLAPLGPTTSSLRLLPIPDFVGQPLEYWLPPGIHSCTRAEIEERFVYNATREKVWRYLIFFLERVRDLGGNLNDIVIDGSFVTGREQPGDVDACCCIDPNALMAMLNGSPDATALLFFLGKPHEAKRLFGVHVFALPTQPEFEALARFFSHGEHPDGLRDPDPLRDPPGVTKPHEKGLLRIQFADFFAGGSP